MTIVVPYGIQEYTRADLPRVTLSNMYAEAVPDSRQGIALFSRPSLSKQATIGPGPGRGIFQQPGLFNGDQFVVSGSSLYRAGVLVGDIGATGIVQIEATDNALLIVSGGKLWRYGTALTQVAFPDDAGVTSVAYLGGYAFALRAGSHRIYFALDTTAWDALDYVSAEQSTDAAVAISVVVDQLWIFCERHTEVFYITGDSLAPIQRVQGRVFDKGSRSRGSVRQFDNAVAWVGQDSVVYRGDNTPVRISDHGIEERIIESVSCSAWVYSWFGHLFYVLQLDKATLVYDAATKQWHDVASYRLPRWRALTGAQNGTVVTAIDDIDGTVWQLTDTAFLDGDQPVVREWTVLLPDPVFADAIALDCAKGKLAAPIDAPGVLEMATSRDNGQTFSAWRQTTLGEQGRYRKRVGFNRLGLVDQDGMVVRFRLTDPVVARISSIRLNDSSGGRSR